MARKKAEGTEAEVKSNGTTNAARALTKWLGVAVDADLELAVASLHSDKAATLLDIVARHVDTLTEQAERELEKLRAARGGGQ